MYRRRYIISKKQGSSNTGYVSFVANTSSRDGRPIGADISRRPSRSPSFLPGATLPRHGRPIGADISRRPGWSATTRLPLPVSVCQVFVHLSQG